MWRVAGGGKESSTVYVILKGTIININLPKTSYAQILSTMETLLSNCLFLFIFNDRKFMTPEKLQDREKLSFNFEIQSIFWSSIHGFCNYTEKK